MECLAGVFGRDYLVVHKGFDSEGRPVIDDVVFLFDSNTGVGNADAPADAWQHVRCGPRITEAALRIAINRELAEQGLPPLGEGQPIDSTVTTLAGAPPTSAMTSEPAGPSSGGGGMAYLIGEVTGGALLVSALVFAGVKLKRRGEFPARNLDRWRSTVTGHRPSERRTFNDKEKRSGLIRCGAQCEWVDPRTRDRCSVVEDVNGMKLVGDHLIPDTLNGQTDLRNLAMLCPTHNGSGHKGGKDMGDDWYAAVFANRTVGSYARGVKWAMRRDGSKPLKGDDNLAPVFEFKRRPAA